MHFVIKGFHYSEGIQSITVRFRTFLKNDLRFFGGKMILSYGQTIWIEFYIFQYLTIDIPLRFDLVIRIPKCRLKLYGYNK